MKGRLVFILVVLVAAIAFGSGDDALLYGEGENLFRERKYDLALETFDTFLEVYPSSPLAPDAWFRRASSLYFLGRHREALDLFRRIELRYRSTRFLSTIPYWKGLSSFRLGEYQGAERELSAFLAEGTRGEAAEQARFYLCLSRKALGHIGGAGIALEDLLATTLAPPRRAAYAAYLLASLKGDKPEEEILLYSPAAEALRAVLPDLEPLDEFRYRLVLGEAALRRGRFQDGAVLLEPAVAEGRTDVETYPQELYTRGLYLYAYALLHTQHPAEALHEAQRALSLASAKEFEAPLYRISFFAALEVGQEEGAHRALESYLKLVPDDPQALFDRARRQAVLGDYRGMGDTAEQILKALPKTGDRDDEASALAAYLQGIARIYREDYRAATESLDRALEVGLPLESLPSARFFAGWSLYRQARYEDALPILREAAQGRYFSRASYYGAWCAFSLQRYPLAVEMLQRALIRREADGGPELLLRIRLLLGQTYGAMGQLTEASQEYYKIFSDSPDSPVAAEAHFEYAGILGVAGELQAAAGEYGKIPDQYPSSSLGEWALLRRGELFYGAELWLEAREAFYDYRVRYPGGRYLDQALYWGALAANKGGERHGALLLLENLVQKLVESPLRPSALRESAEIYIKLGEPARGEGIYRELLAQYPADATAYRLEERLAELRLISQGTAEKEAILRVEAQSAGGLATPRGRQALLDLALFYASQSHPTSEKARPILDDLRRRQGEDPQRAAEAEFLLGRLASRAQEYQRATGYYLAAAAIPGADPDLMARSLLAAAEEMEKAERPDEAARLARLLKTSFPGSDWAAEGERFLGGER